VLEREKHRLIHERDWRRWGCQGRQGDLEALRPAVVLAAGSQEMGPDQPRGARGREGDPVKPVWRGGLEVSGPNLASKPSKIAIEARRGR
jgi:hypothetical protein